MRHRTDPRRRPPREHVGPHPWVRLATAEASPPFPDGNPLPDRPDLPAGAAASDGR
jgi:hypothetical protein